MFAGDISLLEEAGQILGTCFGPVDYRSVHIPFTFTTYYEPEFGRNLVRQFLAFERLVDPGRLAAIKVLTNELEERLGELGRRRVNLDPGYMSEAKLVLATTKNHSHRIYIGQGIYAEVTLSWRDRDWRAWPWTYPDYQSEAYLDVLRTIRGIYCEQIRVLGLKGRVTPPPN